MLYPLGRYGDSHVTPDELYDATAPTARPPRDAIDLQFRTPVTLNTLLHVMQEAGGAAGDAEADKWDETYNEIAVGTGRYVQRCALGVDRERSGLAPVRCAITAVMHSGIVGFTQPRWHLHVYVGATATNLLDGHPVPVDVESLARDVSGAAYPYYANKIEELTNREWGVQWGYPPEWDLREILQPDLVDLVDTRDRGVCTDPDFTDVGQVIFPDQSSLDLAAQSEAVTARARAEGRPRPGAYTPMPVMVDGEWVKHR